MSVIIGFGSWVAGRTGGGLVGSVTSVTGTVGIGLVAGYFAVLSLPEFVLLGSAYVPFASLFCAAVFPPPDGWMFAVLLLKKSLLSL